MRVLSGFGNGDYGREPWLLAPQAPLKTDIPAETPLFQQPRVIVPFIVVEHEGDKQRPARVGILVFDPAAA
jgi:hypothetical protein